MKLANSDMIYTMDIGKHYKQIKAGEGGIGIEYLAFENT